MGELGIRNCYYREKDLINIFYCRCKSCGWPLCSEKCQDSNDHTPGMFQLFLAVLFCAFYKFQNVL